MPMPSSRRATAPSCCSSDLHPTDGTSDLNTESARSLIELEGRFGADNYSPLDAVFTRGEGVHLFDLEGNRYLDFLSAYSAVNQGHNHPRIVAALVEQASRLALTSRAFRNDRYPLLLERLCRLTGFDRALLMNTGAEAVETAIKAARRWAYHVKGVPADRAEIIVAADGFHGRTTTIVGFSTDPNAHDGFGPFSSGFRIVPFGDLDAVAAAIGPTTAAILVEPVQGEAGVIIPPADYLAGLRELADRNNALLILDEIQSGLGRTGKLFAFEHSEIRPDAVTIGKALSGGLYPVSAFLASDDVMAVFTPGTHGSTYGGNPLACAVAEAALGVLMDEELIGATADLAGHFRSRLERLPHPPVTGIRAIGLWAGVDLDPSGPTAKEFCQVLMQRGLLCKDTRIHTIRLAPPLVITKDQLDEGLDVLAGVLSAGV